jgi:protein SCO1/2
LQGQPVVLVMMYTTCEYVCPLLVEDAKQIEGALDEETRKHVTFTMVSFDPARDTPQKLAAYRKKRGLERDNWKLLTAGYDEVLELSAVLGVQFRPDGRGEFLHSNIVTLLDANGVIRDQQVGIGKNRDETVAALKKLMRETY